MNDANFEWVTFPRHICIGKEKDNYLLNVIGNDNKK